MQFQALPITDASIISIWIFLLVPINRDANFNIQKIGRIQTKSKKDFTITCNFSDTKLARNREVAKFGCQNGEKCLQK